MRKLAFAAVGAALALGAAATSASATEFKFTFTDGGADFAAGSLDATANGDGTYTAVSGTIYGYGAAYAGGNVGATGTLIPNPSPPGVADSPDSAFGYDDQLLPGQVPVITDAGPLFAVDGYQVNFLYDGGGAYLLYSWNNNGYSGGVLGDFTVTPAPEPASWAMMLLGFGGIGASMRLARRRTGALPAG